jgi:hypothetical protein
MHNVSPDLISSDLVAGADGAHRGCGAHSWLDVRDTPCTFRANQPAEPARHELLSRQLTADRRATLAAAGAADGDDDVAHVVMLALETVSPLHR